MNRQEMSEVVRKTKIVAILRGVYGDECTELAGVLASAGIRLIEVAYDHTSRETLRRTTETIRKLSCALGGNVLIGAGTVTDTRLVEEANAAGAVFIVSPDTRVDVIRKTRDLQMLSMPGAMTPTEIGLAYDAGGDFIKVFPAGALGVTYFKALRAPLQHIPLLAVGNIDLTNAADYIAAGAVGLGLGSSLARTDLLREGKTELLFENAKSFLKAAGVQE